MPSKARTNRSGEGREGGSLLRDPGSEVRLGGREKRRTKTIIGKRVVTLVTPFCFSSSPQTRSNSISDDSRSPSVMPVPGIVPVKSLSATDGISRCGGVGKSRLPGGRGWGRDAFFFCSGGSSEKTPAVAEACSAENVFLGSSLDTIRTRKLTRRKPQVRQDGQTPKA